MTTPASAPVVTASQATSSIASATTPSIAPSITASSTASSDLLGATLAQPTAGNVSSSTADGLSLAAQSASSQTAPQPSTAGASTASTLVSVDSSVPVQTTFGDGSQTDSGQSLDLDPRFVERPVVDLVCRRTSAADRTNGRAVFHIRPRCAATSGRGGIHSRGAYAQRIQMGRSN